jgi:uncharacterized repeat protein (TIGR04076 family)
MASRKYLLLKSDRGDRSIPLAEGERNRVKDPGIGDKMSAAVTGLKGTCNAGHVVGEGFEISCHNPGGLCGFFYHALFPTLSVMGSGGRYPRGDPDVIEVECPDRINLLSLRLERVEP